MMSKAAAIVVLFAEFVNFSFSPLVYLDENNLYEIVLIQYGMVYYLGVLKFSVKHLFDEYFSFYISFSVKLYRVLYFN
jgi:hypothetical protein